MRKEREREESGKKEGRKERGGDGKREIWRT